MTPYQRTGHKLKRNHSNALPRYVIALDTETLPTTDQTRPNACSHRFRLGVTVSGRLANGVMVGTKVNHFSDTDSLWQSIYAMTGDRHTTWLICHNALFDMIVAGMPQEFLEGRISVDWPRSKRKREDNNEENPQAMGLCIIEGPPTIIAVRVGSTQGRLVIVDTLNWFPCPLSDLGTAIGLEKLPMPAFEDSDSEWFSYCTRDAEIVYSTFNRLVKWVKDNDFGMFRYTAAAQSFAAYRHRFMEHQIYVHDNEYVRTLERQGYFGGRTEVFRMGTGAETVHQLDCNSLFPSVMGNGYFPALLDRYEHRHEYLSLLPVIDYSAATAEVEICTREPIFPVRTNDRVVYPVGRFTTTLCGLELFAAVKRGYVIGVRSWAEYKLRPIFELFVDELWTMRQQYKADGNKLYERFVKGVMNSLYGKFGQLSPDWINAEKNLSSLPWSRWSELDQATGQRTEYRSFGWQIQKHDGRHEIAGTFVAISAFITSAARMRMNWLRGCAGACNVYYQGIDSLIVNDRGLENLRRHNEVSQNEIGKLRLEVSTDCLDIWGCCQYKIGDKLVMSSRSSRTVQDEAGEIMQKKFIAKDDLFNGAAINHVTEINLPWHMSADYHKGLVGADGWIAPLEIGGT